MFAWFWILNLRAFSSALRCMAFFLLAAGLFAYGSAHLPQAKDSAAPYLHMAFLFSIMLGINGIFDEDRREGVLDQWHLWPIALEVIVLGRMAAHWLAQVVPLIICIPLAAIFMQMGEQQAWTITLALALVSLIMLPPMMMMELLTMQRREGSAAALVLIFPIYIPVMLLSLHLCESTESSAGSVGLLAGAAMIAWPLCLWVCARILRHLS